VEPVITSCCHIYCTLCLFVWLSTSSMCPVCWSVTIEEDLQCLSGQLALLYESIHVFCKYNDIGCEAILTLTPGSDHEQSC
jgi:hypothetical protein